MEPQRGVQRSGIAFRLGSWTVEPSTNRLSNGTSRIHLRPQLIDLLTCLARRSGEVLSKQQILDEVWGGQYVSDSALTACVSELRHALQDTGQPPQIIENIPKRGYRLVASVEWLENAEPAGRDGAGSAHRAATIVAAASIGLAVAVVGARIGALRPRVPPLPAAAPVLFARSANGSGRSVRPAAYEKYLESLGFSRSWQQGGCIRAEPLLKQAVALDPAFADAYAELAICYTYPDRMRRPGGALAPEAHEAVARALALDDRLPRAYDALGLIRQRFDFDWNGARSAFERALAIDPNDGQAHASYGELLYASGDFVTGLEHLREGLRLDPLSLDHQVGFGYALRNARRFGEAIEQFKRTLELDPNWNAAVFWLAYTYADADRRDEAIDEYLLFVGRVVVPGRLRAAVATLRSAYAHDGWEAFWREELALAEEDIRNPGRIWQEPASFYSGPFAMARRYARVGDTGRALDWLDRAYADRHHLMPFIDVEPLFDDLRSTARFQQLRARVGLAR